MNRSIGNSAKQKIVGLSEIEQWIRKGYCFQYNRIITLPHETNKYYLFDATAVPDDKCVFVFPIDFYNVGAGPCYVNYRFNHNYAGGSTISITNRNGESDNIPGSIVSINPTGSDLGDIQSQNKISMAGELPSRSGGGDSRLRGKFIVNKSYPVLFEIINDDSSDCDAESFFVFCEVPRKDLKY